MRNKSKFLALLLGTTMVVGLLAGCGEQKPAAEEKSSSAAESSSEAKADNAEKPKDEEPAEVQTINWYRVAWHSNADEQKVEDAINAYIEPLIGVNVNVMNDAESTALDLALNAGDDIDLYWTASWAGIDSFVENKIAYDITDELANYPALYNSMPELAWENGKKNGRNFYVPCYKEMPIGTSLMIPTEVAEQFDWDLSTIKELKDIEPMLADLKAAGFEYPFYVAEANYPQWDKDIFDEITAYAGVRADGSSTKIENIMESAEYKEFVEMMWDWNQAGYINQEEATRDGSIEAELYNSGKVGFTFWNSTPDGKANATGRFGKEQEIIPVTYNWVEAESVAGSCYAINANTEEFDACMKFLELLYTDQTLADLACFGIEGTHYTRNAEGRVVLTADSGYSYPGVWIVTNVMAPSLLEGESADKKEQYEAYNDTDKVCPTNGFTFNTENVSAEVAAIQNVYTEYANLLEKGFYDPADYLPEFQKKLKGAGVDAVIAEMQAQYDAFLATK